MIIKIMIIFINRIINIINIMIMIINKFFSWYILIELICNGLNIGWL